MTGLKKKSAWLLAFALAFPCSLYAQSSALSGLLPPDRVMTIVVGQPAGGTTDVSGRTFAQRLSQLLGRSVVVDNRPGVSGLVAAAAVAKAPGDGLTLLYAPNTLMSAPHLLPKTGALQIDVQKDLVPVIVPSSTSIVLVAHPSLQVKNAKELAALLKKSPGLAYASSGNGSNMQMAAEMYARAAGVSMQHIPYKGVAPALADVVAGHVKVGFNSMALVAPHLASGRLVGLGIADDQRNALLPAVPTLKEQGYDNTTSTVWYGLFAPKATPPAIVEAINRTLNDILQEPAMRTQLTKQWETPLGGPPERLRALAAAEYAATGKLIRELKITAD